ncbi:hypothetical protein CVS40_11993 [Lucilia cuprina]|nr:hypothetical protein CVS40_11993 [Lucilia cuprina]
MFLSSYKLQCLHIQVWQLHLLSTNVIKFGVIKQAKGIKNNGARGQCMAQTAALCTCSNVPTPLHSLMMGH